MVGVRDETGGFPARSCFHFWSGRAPSSLFAGALFTQPHLITREMHTSNRCSLLRFVNYYSKDKLDVTAGD